MKKIILLFTILYALNINAQKRILYNSDAIVIPIENIVNDGTSIKRKATIFTMVFNQSAKQVSLTYIVSHYADSSGYYGNKLTFIPDYSITTVSDNSVAVNPQTGEKLVATTDSTGAKVYATDWMGQYDFFFYIASSVPIKVNDMIKQYAASVTNWNKN